MMQQQSPQQSAQPEQVTVPKKIPFVLPHVLPRRMRDFKNTINDIPIVDYLGIVTRKNEKLSFKMELFPEEKYSIFSVDFVTQNTPHLKKDFLNLPPELSEIINSYSSNFISLRFRIDYLVNYPFDTPIWSLIEEKDDMMHLPRNFALNDYYQGIVEKHNGQYNEVSRGYNWSPSMTIRTDMINFIMRILHFDVITDFCE
jgi:hypothetical protein